MAVFVTRHTSTLRTAANDMFQRLATAGATLLELPVGTYRHVTTQPVSVTAEKTCPGQASDTVNMFGLTFNNMTAAQAVAAMLEESAGSKVKTASFINANAVNEGARHKGMREALATCNLKFASGVGLRLAAKMMGIALKESLTPINLLPALCREMASQNLSVFLYSTKAGAAKAATETLKKRYPNLLIAGTCDGDTCHPNDVIDVINKAATDIVLVAMESPQQEVWMARYAEALNCHSVLAVGDALDLISGNITRAPVWMREFGMEWLYRLLREPKAKFQRYVLGNPTF